MNHLVESVSFQKLKALEIKEPTVVIVSTPQAECSQSIQTISKPIGAMNLAVGTVLSPRYRPTRGGILPE